jgi:hypothetical protein
MKNSGRIPKKLAAFITYVIIVNDYLHTIAPGGTDPRGILLGMTTAELLALKNSFEKLMSGDPANPGIWDLHSNPNTKNKITRTNMVNAMKEFGVFFRPILNRINVSLVITAADRETLNIAPPVIGRKQQKVKIADVCHVKITPLIGGDIKLRFSSTTDASRASKAAGSNAVELAQRVDKPLDKSTDGGANETIGKVKYNALANSEDGTYKTIHTKALFIVQLGTDNTGNYYQFFARWIHTSNPGIAGSWTGPFVVLIP